MLFHLTQMIIYWLVIIIFPMISVLGCVNGHSWMSHVGCALFLGLSLIWDCVFAAQYYERESYKYDLRQFKNGVTIREGKCKYMIFVLIECVFELVMTQIGLFDLYTDVAFATIAGKEKLTGLYALSVTSIVLFMIPKFYAFVLMILLMFNVVKEEDKRRKYAARILIFNEQRMQALNVEHTGYEKQKVDLLMSFLKFILEDLP